MNSGTLLRTAVIFMLVTGLSLTAAFPGTPSRFWEGGSDRDVIAELVSDMNDEELLGQVFFIGYQGTTPTRELRNWIATRNLGGVKIFTRNVATLPDLAADIRDLQLLSQGTRRQIPLLIATDQEGGWVEHIRAGMSRSGGNLSLGAGGVPHDAFLTGFYLGEELKALGVNMNFAPSLDVYSNPQAAPGVSPRFFSSDPLETALLGAAFIQGTRRAGVIATGKHFPGHGDADLDSHGALPEIDADPDTLWSRELLPYRLAIKEGLPAIMSAHLSFPRVTGRRTPASLDPYFIRDVLRGRLGFDGLILTDDMEMNGAVEETGSVREACRRALLAGNDMILVSHTPAAQERTWEYLLQAMREEPLLRERVREGARRVLALKMKTFRGADPFPFIPDPEKLPREIPAPRAPAFFFDSACRGVTMVRTGVVPFRPSPDEKLILIAQYSEFLEEGKKRFPGAATLLYSWHPRQWIDPAEKERVAAAVQSHDRVVFCLANPTGLKILRGLRSQARKIIVVSALTPVYLDELPWVETALAVYGNASPAFRAGFAALAGDFTPEGTLPVSFGGK
ncbi:MAG: glycoside hydrolase family 3 protein [Spirochaetales bacterium]|nr:glycoside hydrolase family 3 protein [Spirochaetales bacterium]